MRCELTGKTTTFGSTVSFSQNKSKRTFKPNIQVKTYPLGCIKVPLKLAASTIRSIRKVDGEEPLRDYILRNWSKLPNLPTVKRLKRLILKNLGESSVLKVTKEPRDSLKKGKS